MPNFGERLREAREKLGLSQQAMADRCGVTMRSQRNYEKGDRQPDADYFAALVGLGLNVEFLLTGNPVALMLESIRKAQTEIAEFKNSLGIKEEPENIYTNRKVKLSQSFDLLDEQGKQAVEAMINALLAKH